MHPLAIQMKEKNERALARAISYVENDHPDKLSLLKDLYALTGNAHYIGITGSPGAGKSSLVNELIVYLRKLELTVGVIAVDPTSPFSGGALLGDRVRMAQHFTDPGVFIRSMGTRGSLGGLSRTAKESVRVMDAYGFDVILIETVGVGQSELDIMKIADTTAVVLTPGSGDAVQIFKAGIMEIADLFIINKADLPGVSKLTHEIESLLDLTKKKSKWKPPIVEAVAKDKQGFQAIWETVIRHQNYGESSGEKKKKRERFLETEVLDIIQAELFKHILSSDKTESWKEELKEGKDPYTIARGILTERGIISGEAEGSRIRKG